VRATLLTVLPATLTKRTIWVMWRVPGGPQRQATRIGAGAQSTVPCLSSADGAASCRSSSGAAGAAGVRCSGSGVTLEGAGSLAPFRRKPGHGCSRCSRAVLTNPAMQPGSPGRRYTARWRGGSATGHGRTSRESRPSAPARPGPQGSNRAPPRRRRASGDARRTSRRGPSAGRSQANRHPPDPARTPPGMPHRPRDPSFQASRIRVRRRRISRTCGLSSITRAASSHLPSCHPCESGDPWSGARPWIPAFVRMTR